MLFVVVYFIKFTLINKFNVFALMETLFIGRNLIFLPEVGSTNSYATELLKNVNVAEGTVVHTANQTQGKGQRGNSWETQIASNLTVSIVLKPTFLELKNQFFLYQITALACYDVMAELLGNSQYDIKIKWPNDILVNGKKIAGILIENIITQSLLNYSVVGVGINVNQPFFHKSTNATSLQKLTTTEFDLTTVLNLLCNYLEHYYLKLRNNKFNEIRTNYLQNLYGLNTWLNFEIYTELKTCIVKGIDIKGLLVLQDKMGNENAYDLKEVKWLI